MFYAILPTTPPIFAVQPDALHLPGEKAEELLPMLERHFMLPVALVSWDEAGVFWHRGEPIAEDLVTDEDLVWREFDLPAQADVPF